MGDSESVPIKPAKLKILQQHITSMLYTSVLFVLNAVDLASFTVDKTNYFCYTYS